ncbi:unnamed protein product [Closterium sp. NIES-54]
MKRAVAAGADLYAVDIAIVEEADKPSDFQKLLEALPSELQDLLKRFPGIFPDDLPEGLPPQRAHDHRIELEPGAQPTIQRQFRLTQPELDKLRKLLYYLLEKKFIRPSSSPFAAPILFTPKNDGGFRMCIDYRALNRVTVKSRYPISRADELIDQLRTARVFSKIDLRGGYHQIRVESSDCAKTTFRTRYGSFEYTVMPFGMTNAPATFQMTMNEAFRPLVDKCVIIYLDDILVYSRDKQQHLDDLEAVFTILDKHRLLTKGSKVEMNRIFGVKKEKTPAPSLTEASERINARGDSLDEKIRKLEAELVRYRDQIKRTRPGPAQEALKARAMRVLKQKKMLEGQRDNLYNQSFNVEQVAFAQEGIKDAQATVAAMKAANKELKTQMKSVKIEDIDVSAALHRTAPHCAML